MIKVFFIHLLFIMKTRYYEHMNNKINLKIIMGSTREGRFSDKVANWINEELKKYEEVVAEIIDLRDYEMPFFNEAVSPSSKKEPYKNEVVVHFTAKIQEADTFIIIAPEYNHGAPAVLKNALDWVYQEWNNKPVAFIGYGTVGAARSIEQLRLNAIELQMAPIREAIHINGEQYFPVIMGEGDIDELLARYAKKAEIVINQLLWWAKALKNARINTK